MWLLELCSATAISPKQKIFRASLGRSRSKIGSNFANDAGNLLKLKCHFGHTIVRQKFLASRPKQAHYASMKTLPQNVVAFRIAGWDVHLMNQRLLKAMRRIADRRDWTIEDVINDAVYSFVARHEAEAELETKIIPFPRPH